MDNKPKFCVGWRFLLREYIVSLPAIAGQCTSIWLSHREKVNGTTIVDPSPDTYPYFKAFMNKALMLISQKDPARFARAKRYIKTFIHVHSATATVYTYATRLCAIDLRCFYDPDNPESMLRTIAASIVHDATIGRLNHLGIISTGQNRRQFYSLCAIEADRFVKRLGASSSTYGAHFTINSAGLRFWRRAIASVSDIVRSDPSIESKLWREILEALEASDNEK